MRILLDTHTMLWAIADDIRLTQKARKLILDESNTIYYSAASIWEICIKHGKSPEKLPFTGDAVCKFCDAAGFLHLPVKAEHAIGSSSLRIKEGATTNSDPFDRILIAQAKTEDMLFLTHDTIMQYYDEPCIVTY